ncbi:hypothetical protein GCM10010987_44180 [Bradyrhizobium guangdongense]|uniref:DUF4365 domain-containing protein n=1 Tax=Bradyrhizobium guangdongense TaxID=1325090 RepID=A0AA87W829_9BRAD|nr:hypothetical protein XH86_40275 [Bradyrhizobium guangdongense]GGI27396.1 hypothetical protein GCM10010987_44180 [Bradyrhizobium guangdongense]
MKNSVSVPDLGARGENVFIGWCEPEGFRAQKSQADRLGWDYLLEGEPLRMKERPLDSQNDLPKFLIQVKATEGSQPPRIKLSALKHLVDADLPAAIVVMFFVKDGRTPIRTLLVPVDQKMIYDTLKRVRSEEAKGKRNIHRITILVPLDRAVELSPAGEGLAKALNGMLGGAPADYIAGKVDYRKTCGFDNRSIVGRFFVPGENAGEKIGQLFLGGPRTLKVTDLTIERRRFGIPLDNDRDEFREAVLELNVSSSMSTTVELSSEAGEWTSVELEMFVTPIFDGKLGPVRLANNFLEFLIDFPKAEANLTLNYDGERIVDLEEAVAIIEIGVILARPQKSITLRFKGKELKLEMAPGEGPFAHWIPAAPVLRRIVSAMVRAGRQTARRFKFADFVDWVDTHIEFLAVASTPGVNIIFNHWPDEIQLTSDDALLTPFSLECFGSRYTALIELPIVSSSRSEPEVTLIGGRPHIVSEVVRALNADTSDFVESAVERSNKDRGSKRPAFFAEGFSNWDKVMLSIS